MNILQVMNLEVVYNDVVLVLKGLSLDVTTGSITTLLGANGAGKSTTLKAISGLLAGENGKVTSGSIMYDGTETVRLVPEKLVRAGVFQVMEGRRIFEDLTVEENLRCGGYTQPARLFAHNSEKVYAYFPRLKERRHQLAGYMSGGEQQMLAISRALMARPRLLLLDEPSLGLAPIIITQIFDIIRKVNESGTTVFLVEQNANQALKIAHRAYVMENGRITLEDSGAALLSNEDVKKAYLGI